MHGELAGSSLFTSRLVFPDFAARSRCTPFPAVRDEIKREDRRHEHRKDAVRETTAAAVLSNIDVERGPSIQRERLSTLPEHWDTNTLEQDFKEHTSHIRCVSSHICRNVSKLLLRKLQFKQSFVPSPFPAQSH